MNADGRMKDARVLQLLQKRLDAVRWATIKPTRGTSPAMTGAGGGPDYVCGGCGLLLVTGVGTNTAQLLIECWNCGSINVLDIRPTV